MSEGFKTKSAPVKKSNRYQPKPQEVASMEAIQKSLVDNFGDIKDPSDTCGGLCLRSSEFTNHLETALGKVAAKVI